MANDVPNWSINPIALAELISGMDLTQEKDPDEILNRVFGTRQLDAIFDAVGGEPARLVILQRLADAVSEPEGLDKILQHPLAKKAIEWFGEDTVRRVLPFLVPVADVMFAGPGVGPPGGGERPIGNMVKFEDSEYIVSDVSYLDPQQGNCGDCYLIAAMIALAWSRPADWAAQVKKTKGQYRYKFYGGTQAEFKKVDATLPRDGNGKLLYARSSTNPAEAWPGMFEKACVMWRLDLAAEPTSSQYFDLRKLHPHIACRVLAGGEPHSRRGKLGVSLANDVVLKLCDSARNVAKYPTIASTSGDLTMLKRAGLWPNHAYAVLGFYELGDEPQHVVLRNPHLEINLGLGYPTAPWRPPAAPDPGAGGAEVVNLNACGVFALPATSFDEYMQEVGWAAP